MWSHGTRRRARRPRKNGARHAVEMTRRGKRGKVKRRTFPLFPPRLEIRPQPQAPDFHIPTASAAADSQVKTRSEEKAKPDRSCAIKTGHLDKLRTPSFCNISLAYEMSGSFST